MLEKMNTKYLPYILIAISFLILILLALIFDGTGDDGDSITHYLFAHTAFNNPRHFFDHWAKPLFVLLSAPFAYFGFTAMKIFNVICLSVTLIMTYKIAEALKIKNAWLTTLIIMCCSYVLSQSLSGLTEPLFSAFLSFGIYLLIKKRYIIALIFLSFLPFVRSEGLIILSVLCIYLIFIQKLKLIPLLMGGHFIYGLLGLIYYDTPLWVFKSIPYAHLSTPYGKGDWFHFYNNMQTVLGKGLNIFWNIGMVVGLYRLVIYLIKYKEKKYFFSTEELWLVYGMFTAFFLSHTIFWALGIFWSYGLLRVFVGVIPLIAIICLIGFNFILGNIQKLYSNLLIPAITFFSLLSLFYFYKSTSIYNFQLNSNQKIQARIANTYGKEWEKQSPKPTLYYNTPYLGMLLQKDTIYFETSKYKRVSQFYDGSAIPYYMYLIWDKNYATIEGGITANKLFGDKRLRLINSESEYDNFYGQTNTFHIFMRDTSVQLKSKGILYSFLIDKKWDKKWNINNVDTPRIVTLNKINSFSPGYIEFLKLLDKTNTSKRLKVSFDASVNKISKNDWENAKLVFSVQRDGKDIFWKGIPIQERMQSENQWEKLEFSEPLPHFTSPDDKINIYIWNDNVSKIMVKNFKIELFE